MTDSGWSFGNRPKPLFINLLIVYPRIIAMRLIVYIRYEVWREYLSPFHSRAYGARRTKTPRVFVNLSSENYRFSVKKCS